MSRNCMHLVTGAVTYYTVFPVMYAGSILSFAWRVYEIRRGTKRRKYRDTRPGNTQRDQLDSQNLLQKQLQDMESEKARGWTDPPTIRGPSMVPAYEPPDYVTVVESADLLPGNQHLKPERFSMRSHHSRIGSVSSALQYYFDVSAPPPMPSKPILG